MAATMVTVIPVARPADLENQSPGNLDPSLLVQIHPRGQLHHLAADAWRASVAACGKIGLPLTFIYGGMYRLQASQLKLWYQRWSPVVQYNANGTERDRRWWNGSWWWLRPGMAAAGAPGSSWHEWALAVDTAFDRDPSDGLGPDDAASIISHPKWNEFVPLMLAHGWSWENRPRPGQPGGSEPWHVRYVAGDQIPVAVQRWKAEALGQLPPFDPDHGQFSLYPVTAKAVAKRGSSGDLVRYLQAVLARAGFSAGAADGKFGPRTEQALMAFQRDRGITADGWAGPETWRLIDAAAVSP